MVCETLFSRAEALPISSEMRECENLIRTCCYSLSLSLSLSLFLAANLELAPTKLSRPTSGNFPQKIGLGRRVLHLRGGGG